MTRSGTEETRWSPLVGRSAHRIGFEHPFQLPFDAYALTTIMPYGAVRATAVGHTRRTRGESEHRCWTHPLRSPFRASEKTAR